MKYYKAEDVQELITACEWRMTLAKERHGEGFVDYSKQVLDVDELTKRLSYLPTLEVSEDCISREYIKTIFENNLTGTCKDVVVHTIASAPSVVPSRAEGEWIYIDEPIMGNPYGRYRCSECELEEPHKTDYCPNCGAKMTYKE